MTTDLWMLVCSGLLGAAIPMLYLVGRAQRAHANMTENLTLFAILVLVAHVSGRANSTTAVGAQMFFWSRVAHVLVYTAGITVLRTVVFFVGVAGEVLILVQLFG